MFQVTNIDTTQLLIQMQLLTEENKLLLEKLESGKNEPTKHSGNLSKISKKIKTKIHI